MPYVITDVYCGVCKKSIAGSDHWVYRGGLKLLCPDCGLTYEWPYRLDVKEECVQCGKSPDFVLGDDPNRPILYCKKCMESKVVAELSELAEREPTPINFLRWLGAFFVAVGLLPLFGTIVMLSGGEFNICLGGVAALCIVSGVLMIVYNKAAVQSDLELQRKRRAAAREILDRISKGGMSVEQRLAVFGLVPGNPFRTGYISYALQQVQPVSALPETLSVVPVSSEDQITVDTVRARIAAGLCPKCGKQVAPSDQNCPSCRINLAWARQNPEQLARRIDVARCDICNQPGMGTVVKARDMSEAVRRGFNPFKEGLVPDLMAQFGMGSSYDTWRAEAISGRASLTDWNVCDRCMRKLQPYLPKNTR